MAINFRKLKSQLSHSSRRLKMATSSSQQTNRRITGYSVLQNVEVNVGYYLH